jgi:hypothetical protein
VSEEWCLHLQLDGDEAELAELVDRFAERLPPSARLTRGPVLRVYSDSELVAAEIEETLVGLLEETSLGYELWQERWDEESGEWEELAPEGPGGDAPAPAVASDEQDAERPALDLASLPQVDWRERGCWLVKVELADNDAAEAFLEQLKVAGADAHRSGHRVGVLVPDSGTAASLAGELEARAPAGATVQLGQASRVERLAYGVS